MVPNFSPSASAFSSYASRGNEVSSLIQPEGSIQPPGQPKPSPKKGYARKYFPADWLLPVALKLQPGASGNGGNGASAGSHRPTLLLHAEDAEFAGRWFSPAIDLGEDNGNPVFWMLWKTARDTWRLSLRRGKGEVAGYRAKTKIRQAFPVKLKRIRTSAAFKDWPSTITISE